MKELKDFFVEEFPQYYDFKIFITDKSGCKRVVGMATLKEGQDMYHIKIWSFLNEKFFLVPNRNDPKRFFIMTREALKYQTSKRKFSWNIVGCAKADDSQSTIELSFDLFDRKCILNIIPEQGNTSFENKAAA
jgi:hypothetical protein